MNILELYESADKNLITGTTCANCIYTKDQVSTKVLSGDLNQFGGITATTQSDKKNARAADIITMPGKKLPTTKHMCNNPNVMQWVTERMCCNLWDHPGLIRNFDGKEPKL